MPDSATIHRTAQDAWRHLVSSGALDLKKRDTEFADEIRKMLDPSAKDVLDALARVTTDQLVRAFFRALQPFSEMYREILRFYQAAGAKYGQQQWKISIEGDQIELADFEDFVRLWDSVQGEIDVPAAGKDEFGALWRAWEAYPQLGNLANRAAREPVAIGVDEVDDWLDLYRSGTIAPLPIKPFSDQHDAGFRDLAAVAAAAHEAMVTFSQNRPVLHAQIDWHAISQSDPFSINHLASRDMDNWLGSAIAGLTLATKIDPHNRERIARVLRETFEGLPTRKLHAKVSVNDLDRFLSLPVWQKRHEIYAVWIFTEMVAAVNKHDLEVHHDHGQLAFEFRETRLATITSARPQLELITERRSPLANPLGAGRTANVQPDFGVWTQASSGDRCTLVVEVKHYKQSANRSFSEVLADYAAAHQHAQIVLVNYGPIGVLDRIPVASRARCVAIDRLTPLNRSARTEFAKLVRNVVGEPIRPVPVAGGVSPARSAIAIDVSGSMASILRDTRFYDLLASIAVSPHASELFPIDKRVHDSIPVDEAGRLRYVSGDINTLDVPVELLLSTYEEIVVLTDRDGVNDLSRLDPAIEELAGGLLIKANVRRL